MSRWGVWIAAIAAASLSVACVSFDKVSIESTVDPEYGQVVRKLYVVVDTQDTKIGIPTKVLEQQTRGRDGEQETVEVTRTRTASLGDYLRAAFEARFSSLGVDTRAVVLTGLELDENEIDRGRVDFGATTTMTVRRTGEKVDVHRGGYYSGGVYIPTTSTTITYFFDVSLWDAALDRRVWRARLAAAGEFDPDTAEAMIDDIVVSMSGDGLLDLSAAQKQGIPKQRSRDSTAGFLLVGMLVPLALVIGLTLPLLLM